MDVRLAGDFRRFSEAAAGASPGDEVDVACLVARTLDPSVDAAAIAASLRALCDDLSPGSSPWEGLRGLGFAGNRANYQALENSNLARVLQTRQGIPITLAIVLIHVARAGGARSWGINHPGHFLVAVDDTLVDPFVMEAVDERSLLSGLAPEVRQLPPERWLAPASPVAIGLRMLNNVRLVHVQASAWDQALAVVDAQVLLAPAEPALQLERSDLWRRLGLAEPARAAAEEALRLADALPSPRDEQARNAARMRLRELGGATDVLH